MCKPDYLCDYIEARTGYYGHHCFHVLPSHESVRKVQCCRCGRRRVDHLPESKQGHGPFAPLDVPVRGGDIP